MKRSTWAGSTYLSGSLVPASFACLRAVGQPMAAFGNVVVSRCASTVHRFTPLEPTHALCSTEATLAPPVLTITRRPLL